MSLHDSQKDQHGLPIPGLHIDDHPNETPMQNYGYKKMDEMCMALGARRGDILGLVIRQGALLVVAGAVVGLGAAAASSRVLESFLYGVTTDDRLTFVAAPLVLVAVALVACWLPARRATRVDPMEVLRDE